MAQSKTVIVNVNVTGTETGEVFAGQFEVRRRLTLSQIMNQDRVRRQIIGPMPDGATQDVASFAFMLSYLQTRIVGEPNAKVPAWWELTGGGAETEDVNLVPAIFDAVTKAVNEAEAELKGQATAAAAALKERAGA